MQTSMWRRGLIAALAIGATGIALSTAVPSAGAAPKPLVRATLVDQGGTAVGEVVFKGSGALVSRIEVEVDAPGAPGLGDFHGFHIHTNGACTAPFTSAGGHWSLAAADHGAHTGDMPSVLIHADGQGYAEFETDRFDVSALLDTDGSAVILHAGRDNFANIPTTYSSGGVPGPNTATKATGDSGGRYACGVVTPA